MKGLGSLIKALTKIKKEGCSPFKLLVLGRDRQNPYLRLAKKIWISEEVIFAGSTNEPEKYYGAADLLIHPTFYDACSLTVLEALASGLPVITTSSNGASGVISQGVEGRVIGDPKDGEELKREIKYFFDKDIRYLASLQGRKRAETYSEEVNFDRMMGIFREAIKEH